MLPLPQELETDTGIPALPAAGHMKRQWDSKLSFSLFTFLWQANCWLLGLYNSLPHLIKQIILVRKACLDPQKSSVHSLQTEAAKFHPGRNGYNAINLCMSWNQPVLVWPSQLPRMQLWATLRPLQRIWGGGGGGNGGGLDTPSKSNLLHS